MANYKKIARAHPSLTMGQLKRLCDGLGCQARWIDGKVWVVRVCES